MNTCTVISRKRLICTDFSPGMGSKTKAGFAKENSYIVLAKTPSPFPPQLDKNKKSATLVNSRIG